MFGLTVMFSLLANAQEFPVAWKSKFSFNPDRWFYDPNAKFVLGRNDEQAEVLDGATGKSLWKLNFKNDLKVKALARATYNYGEGIVIFFNADEKKKPGEKIIVDFATGKELWRTNEYAGIDTDNNYHFANNMSSLTSNQTTIVFDNVTKKFTGLDVRSGKVKWQSKAYPAAELSKNVGINIIEDSEYAQILIYDENMEEESEILMSIITGEEIDKSKFTSKSRNLEKAVSGLVVIAKTLDANRTTLVGRMKGLGNKIKFELEVKGESNWTKKFEGTAVRQLWKDRPYVKMDVQGDKIFVMSKNITVFDLKTGNLLWETPFDNCDASAGLKAKQEFGIAGWPLLMGSAIYYVDLQNDNAIKKVEAQTGKVIWKSEKLKSNDRVPNLMVLNGVLVAQFGGMLNTQIYIPGSGSTGSTYKTENRFDGNFEVRAFDANTGALLWNTSQMSDKLGDKFKDRISTIYPLNNKIVVASGQNLFCLEPKTGAVVYKTSLAERKIGDMIEVIVDGDFETLIIFCDNGIARANASTGKIIYATKTDELYWKAPGTLSHSFSYGDNMFVWVGEKDFIGFDLNKGVVKGKMKDNTNPQMTDDGNYILVRDDEKVTRYAVNK